MCPAAPSRLCTEILPAVRHAVTRGSGMGTRPRATANMRSSAAQDAVVRRYGDRTRLHLKLTVE
jgi:hypothetical protein